AIPPLPKPGGILHRPSCTARQPVDCYHCSRLKSPSTELPVTSASLIHLASSSTAVPRKEQRPRLLLLAWSIVGVQDLPKFSLTSESLKVLLESRWFLRPVARCLRVLHHTSGNAASTLNSYTLGAYRHLYAIMAE